MSGHADAPTSREEWVITRTFHAPRALVFRAWSESDRLRQWWVRRDSS